MNEVEVQQRARSFISGLDIKDVGDDLSVYVKAANAKLVFEELDEGEAGYTMTKPNGRHVITVNSLEPKERQRFTVCHEVAHIVLELESRHEEVPSWSCAKRDINEVYCDSFAVELLMPYMQWKSTIPKDEEPSKELIEQMAERFGVSFPAAASRYASLADLPCCYVTMDHGVVKYAAMSMPLRKVGARVFLKTPIPLGSVAHRLRAAGRSGFDVGEVAQDVWFENLDKGLDMRELSRHYRQADITQSLLWFDHDELPEMEINRFGKVVREDEGLSELTGELPWPKK